MRDSTGKSFTWFVITISHWFLPNPLRIYTSGT